MFRVYKSEAFICEKKTLLKIKGKHTFKIKINFAQYKLIKQNKLGLTLLTRYQP